MSTEPMAAWHDHTPRPDGDGSVLLHIDGAAIVQVIEGDPSGSAARVVEVCPAQVTVTSQRVVAHDGQDEWSWRTDDQLAVVHGHDAAWTILAVPGIPDFGVAVPAADVAAFRSAIARLGVPVRVQDTTPPPPPPVGITPVVTPRQQADRAAPSSPELPSFAAPPPPTVIAPPAAPAPVGPPAQAIDPMLRQRTAPPPVDAPQAVVTPPVVTSGARPFPTSTAGAEPSSAAQARRRGRRNVATLRADLAPQHQALAGIDAREVSAWFGTRLVLDRVSLTMQPGHVTALIGPSGCGKSTFLRILNRMHEMIPGAQMAGQVLVDDHDIYDPERKLTDARREVGMVFQKPNPFPAMSIYDNVLASFRLTGVKATQSLKDEIVESCLSKAGLWKEVKDRLRQPGGGLSGGQQQRLCIARALALTPRVLLMDEPCSALDPTSTRRIEETIMEIVSEVTIVIVTHNMQQAARVSDHCAFFLAEHGTPGVIVEHGPTKVMFDSPQDPRTYDYVMGRFG